MAKIRVYELAREVGITTAALRAQLLEMGVEVSSASSSLDETTVATIKELLHHQQAASPAEEESGLETLTLPASATVKDFAQALDADVENVLEELSRLGHPHLPNQIIVLPVANQLARGWGYRVVIQQEAPPPPPPPPAAPPAPAVEETVRTAPRVVVIEKGREKERIAERRMKPPAAPAPRPEPVVEEAPPPPPVVEEEPPAPPKIWRPEAAPDAPHRPAVVTVMGHVDHGKTTLLDYIRKSNVTAGEAGGITQHVGAYQVVTGGRQITFLDTPGHEAFTAIRARGAQVTDIAVLVVGADDGVKPQTLEAIDHARAAEVPIVVAINKIDRAEANIDRVRRQLAEAGLLAVEIGGETEMVPVCAKDGTGVDALLDTLLALSDLLELRGAVDRPAAGTIIESALDRRRGHQATVIVQEGVLRIGDAVVVGLSSGKIRMMSDDRGQPMQEAGPSTPAVISGIAPVPQAGDVFQVVENEKTARQIAEARRLSQREDHMRPLSRASLQDLYEQIQAGEVKELNLVLKVDTQGSLDAIAKSLLSLHHAEVKVSLLHGAIGEITESDVLLAAASNGIIIGFQVGIDAQAKRSSADEKVEIRLYQIIYDVIDDVRQALVGLLPVQEEEVVLGEAEIRALFRSSSMGTVAGCLVQSGKMVKGAKVRIRRNGDVVFTGSLQSLRHVKEDLAEVAAGMECGITVQNFSDFRPGDRIEAFEVRQVRRKTL